MKNKLFIFISAGFLFIGYNTFAQESYSEHSGGDVFVSRDPFLSQLPKKEIPIKAEPLKQLPTKIEKIPAPILKEIINPPELFVTGIVWGTERPQAIVNGQVVDIGSVIADAKIISIHRAGVEISYKGEIFTFELVKADDAGPMAKQLKSRAMGIIR